MQAPLENVDPPEHLRARRPAGAFAQRRLRLLDAAGGARDLGHREHCHRGSRSRGSVRLDHADRPFAMLRFAARGRLSSAAGRVTVGRDPDSWRRRWRTPAATSPTCSWEVRDGVAVLTLNRPERLNALSRPMLDAAIATLERLCRRRGRWLDRRHRAGRGFCAGGDVTAMGDASANADWSVERKVDRQRAIHRLSGLLHASAEADPRRRQRRLRRRRARHRPRLRPAARRRRREVHHRASPRSASAATSASPGRWCACSARPGRRSCCSCPTC
jgi:hypothetical protein